MSLNMNMVAFGASAILASGSALAMLLKFPTQECDNVKHDLGKYVVNLLDVIGSGSFGIVYKGKKKQTDTIVAVKKLTIDMGKNRCMAKDEIRHMMQLKKHPNLVHLLDFIIEKNAVWMVMEFCTDGDLEKYMGTYQLELREKLHLMVGSASGIAHMHEEDSQMVHRDIKPANILLFREGNGTLLAKVADFGFAKMADSADTFGLYKSIVGTPLFQAPELFQRSQYDSSVDVFALGLTYLSMIQHTVCRDPLYPRLESVEGGNVVPIGYEMMKADEQDRPQPNVAPRNGKEEPLLGEIKDIIAQMAKFQPGDRISAKEVKAQLTELQKRY